jgi:SET domain-containing protein
MPRKIVARKSAIHGNGVFALAPIAKGERVIEYKGRRRTHAEVDAGDSGGVESGHTFLFTLNDDYVIDANYEGNSARWINHSCDPNCEAVLEEHEGKDHRKDRVFIEAKRRIKPGEELTYDYGITLDEPHTARLKKIWACRCGAKNCTGTMLRPKR